MNKTPKKEDFGFKKVHILNGVVSIEAYPKIFIDEIQYTPKISDEFPMEPHKDLTSELEKLKRPLGKIHGLLDVETLIDSKDFEATKEQKKAAKIHTQVKMNEIVVTGIKVTGEGQNQKCTITGKYKGMAINANNIRLFGDGLGFEDEVNDAVKKIIDETYEYLYKDKVVKPEPLDGEDDNPASED